MADPAFKLDSGLKPLSDSLQESLASQNSRISGSLGKALGGSSISGAGFKNIKDKIQEMGERMAQSVSNEMLAGEAIQDVIGLAALAAVAANDNVEALAEEAKKTAANIDPNQIIDNFGKSPTPSEADLARQAALADSLTGSTAANDNVETPNQEEAPKPKALSDAKAANDNQESDKKNEPPTKETEPPVAEVPNEEATQPLPEQPVVPAQPPQTSAKNTPGAQSDTTKNNQEQSNKPEPPAQKTAESPTGESATKPQGEPADNKPPVVEVPQETGAQAPTGAATPAVKKTEGEPEPPAQKTAESPTGESATKPQEEEAKAKEQAEAGNPPPNAEGEQPAEGVPAKTEGEPEPPAEENKKIDNALDNLGVPLVPTDEYGRPTKTKEEEAKAKEQAEAGNPPPNADGEQPTEGAPENKNQGTPQEGAKRGKITQGINYLRNYQKITELKNEIKKINKKIKPLEHLITLLKIAYWSLYVVEIFIRLLAIVLALTIVFLIFFPLAEGVWAAASIPQASRLAIKKEIKALEKSIEEEKKKRDKKEKEVKKYQNEIKNLAIQRNNLKNQALLSQGDPNTPPNT